MPNKIFLDANIVLDLMIATREFSTNTQKIITEYVDKDKILVIDNLTLSILSYIGIEKKKHTRDKTLKFIQDILYNDDIWEVCYLNKKDDLIIINLMKQHPKYDYEDLHHYLCAQKSGCEFIVSNDKKFPKIDLEIKETSSF